MNKQDFINKFHLDNYEELEYASQEAKKYFRNFSGSISFEEVSKRFPVEIYRNRIKILYPTYKIRVIDDKNLNEEVLGTLRKIKNVDVEIEKDVVKYPSMKTIWPISVYCKEENLSLNKKLVDKIRKILENYNIEYEQSVEKGEYYIWVNVDEKGDIVGVQQ